MEFRDISFVNFKNVSGKGGALYVEASNVLIKDANFHANMADGVPNDIHMAGDAIIEFSASAGKSIEVDGGITSEGLGNVIRKSGAGTLVIGLLSDAAARNAFVGASALSQSAPSLNLNGTFLIQEGTVKFDLPQSSITELILSDNANIGINIDLVGNATSQIWSENMDVSALSILSVSMLNGELSFGASRDFLWTNNPSTPGYFQKISGGRHVYRFKWMENEETDPYRFRGNLRYIGVRESSNTISGGSIKGDGSIFANLRTMGIKTSFNFDAARMKTARLGDAPVWLMLHNDGGYISQGGGNFRQSASGIIVGGEWSYQSGAFLSFKKVDASQDGDNASGNDIELGFYRAWNNDKVRVSGMLSLGFQDFNVNNGAANIKSKSARFAIEGELIDPIKSRAIINGKSYGAGPFIGMRAGYIMADKIKTKVQVWQFIDDGAGSQLENKTKGEATIPAAVWMKLETLGGMKGWYKIEDFVFYGRLFGVGALMGSAPKFQHADGEIYGADDGFLMGLGLGIEYERNADLAFFIDSSFERGVNSFQYALNIGLKFKVVKSKLPPPPAPKRFIRKPKPKPKPIPPPPPKKEEPSPPPKMEVPAIPKEATRDQASATRKNAVQSFKVAAASFQSGRTDLSYEGKANIRLLAEQIKRIGYKNILVEGHTDSSGNEILNMDLSRQRANGVLIELSLNGIEVQKMSYIGYGSQNPIAPNTTAEGKARNRRVEIVIE
jgi:outer membrane protein OmpA-like peptidoglycan-associated protein